MFASENLLLHDLVQTLELKHMNVRWYAKEIILTDRALYLYKERSNYVHDAHTRMPISKFRANLPMSGGKPLTIENVPYKGDLPPMNSKQQIYNHLAEIKNNETGKKKILACSSSSKAKEFVNLFNLVSSFNIFDDDYAEQLKAEDEDNEMHQISREEHKRIEMWVQNFVIKNQEGKGETLRFQNENLSQCGGILHIIEQYFVEEVTSMVFRYNLIGDHVFKTLNQVLQVLPNLQKLELSNNQITTYSLRAFGELFSACPKISELNLSQNYIGGGGPDEKQLMDSFLFRFFTELEEPKSLDLSSNQLSDESLYALIKYTFANLECTLEYFNVENNRLTPYANRTLLKAHSLLKRGIIKFRYGPMSLNLENLKSTLHANAESMEITIKRKCNNFSESGGGLKRAPVARQDREKMEYYQDQIESYIKRRDKVPIEELREFVKEITSANVEFEIPRYLLEPIFNVINSKLDGAVEHENLYAIEVLLDCLRFMNARNGPAERKYGELAQQAASVAQALYRVINMEIKEESEIQRLLVQNLRIGKRLGMRGELIDVARHLYMLTDKVLEEMRGEAAELSDDEDEGVYDVNEEDRPLNVYDARMDKYIGMSAKEMGLAQEVEIRLASHPYSTDYLKLANVDLRLVRRFLAEARKYLKDEESYAYRNIFERCSVLLSDAGENSETSITYNLARNDSNLRLARVLFRYRFSLDELFPQKFKARDALLEVIDPDQYPETNPKLINKMLKQVNPESMSSGTKPLETSITELPSPRTHVATKFSEKLTEALGCEGEDLSKKTQELFEIFIVSLPDPSQTKTEQKKTYLLNTDLKDEFYLQLFRLGRSDKYTVNALRFLSLLSSYYGPESQSVHQGIFHWCLELKDKFFTPQERALINFILSNLTQKEGFDDDSQDDLEDDDDYDRRAVADKRNPANETKKGEEIQPFAQSWPPSLLEMQSIFSGKPIVIEVRLALNSDEKREELIQKEVDGTTTVEGLLDSIIQTHPYFQKEDEVESYWLYRRALNTDFNTTKERIGNHEFDIPLARDKKILKLQYQAEKDAAYIQGQDESQIGLDQTHKYHFIIKKRIFASLYVLKNFTKLHKRQKDQLFLQLRAEYLEKNLLKDVCSRDDVVQFGALILKIKLQAKLLGSKQRKITQELISKNIAHAIPKSFLESSGLKVQHWAEKIEEVFKKKEFNELPVDDAQERFLSQIGLYNIVFGSHYVVTKNSSDRRAAERMDMLSRMMASRAVPGMHQSDDGDFSSSSDGGAFSEDDDSLGLDTPQNKKQQESTIPEADSDAEETSRQLTEERLSETDPSGRQSNLTKSHLNDSKRKEGRTRAAGLHNVWSQIQDDQLLLVINMQGIQVLENSKRDRVALLIDFEDILYVMGKGNCLKIGFIHGSHSLMDQGRQTDQRTELYTHKMGGLKARVIAEEIISYMQLRLAEMTKNDQIEYTRRLAVSNQFDQLQRGKGADLRGSFDDSLGDADPQHRRMDDASFDGLADLKINDSELLDSQDLDRDDSEGNIIQGLGQARAGGQGDRKDNTTAAERYQLAIKEQLGNVLVFKQENFFAFRKSYPLYSNNQPEVDEHNITSIASNQGETKQYDGTPKQGLATPSPPDDRGSYQSLERPRVAGSLSQKTRFNLELDQPRIEEDDENEEDSSILEKKDAPQQKPKPEAPVEEAPPAAPAKGFSNVSSFMAQLQSMNQPVEPTTPVPQADKSTTFEKNASSQSLPGVQARTPLQPLATSKEEVKSQALSQTSSQPKFDFGETSTKEEREAKAAEVFSHLSLMMPPPP